MGTSRPGRAVVVGGAVDRVEFRRRFPVVVRDAFGRLGAGRGGLVVVVYRERSATGCGRGWMPGVRGVVVAAFGVGLRVVV